MNVVVIVKTCFKLTCTCIRLFINMWTGLCVNIIREVYRLDTCFSTLYTSIPHTSLKEALTSLIKEAYKVRDNISLVVDTKGTAFWTARAASKHNITEEKLIKLVEYLIDNIYVSIGNRVYRQCVGIPMGTDCAPLLANLTLGAHAQRGWSVCLFVDDYSRTTGYEAAYERYQQLQCYKGMKKNVASLLKRLRSRDMA